MLNIYNFEKKIVPIWYHLLYDIQVHKNQVFIETCIIC